jgi:hypothetical protein
MDDPDGKCPIGLWKDIEPDDTQIIGLISRQRARESRRKLLKAPVRAVLRNATIAEIETSIKNQSVPLWLVVESGVDEGKDPEEFAEQTLVMLSETSLTRDILEFRIEECVEDGILNAAQAQRVIDSVLGDTRESV